MALNVNTIARTAFQAVLDWMTDETPQTVDIDATTIAVGDRFTCTDVTIEILAKTACPYLTCPPEWSAAGYDTSGVWLYCWSETPDFTDYVPEAALVKALALDEWAVA